MLQFSDELIRLECIGPARSSRVSQGTKRDDVYQKGARRFLEP